MAFKNRSGIKDIKINFNLSKLEKRLRKNANFLITKPIKQKLYKSIAKNAKNNIKNSRFSGNKINVNWDTMTGTKTLDLRDSTKYIRKWRGNRENPPLIETGKLLNSIKATKTGIEMEDYGQHHLDGYKIKANKFTKKWNIKAGTNVPARNFLQVRYQDLDVKTTQAESATIVRTINDIMKQPNKTIGR